MLHKKKENENRIVIRVDGQFRYDVAEGRGRKEEEKAKVCSS